MKRPLAAVLAIVYLASHVALADAAQANLWADRRNASFKRAPPLAQLASLPLTYAPPRDTFKQFPSVFPPQFAGLLEALPRNAGRLKEFYVQPGKDAPLVFLIQDVHLNTEAQKNIAEILLALNDESSRLSSGQRLSVGVEAAFGPFDFTRLRQGDEKVVKAVADDFLKKTFFAAPTYAGMTMKTPGTDFFGIDDRAHYDANVETYRQSASRKDALVGWLTKVSRSVEERKAATLNTALKTFDAKRAGYWNGNVGLGEFVTFLSQGEDVVSPDLRRFLDAYRLETSLDLRQVERERAAALEKLAPKLTTEDLRQWVSYASAYRTGQVGFADYYRAIQATFERHGIGLSSTPVFEAYIRYVVTADGIDADRLLASVAQLEQRALTRLTRTPVEASLMGQSRDLYLVKKLADFGLTPDEWTEYQGRSARLREVGPGLDPAILPSFESFYREADIRSRRMVENLLARSSGGKGPLCMVAGGFHAPLLTAQLKSKDLSYAVIQPNITKVDGKSGTEYLSVFARDKKPLDALFEGEKLFLGLDWQAVGDKSIENAQRMARLAEAAIIGAKALSTQPRRIVMTDIPEIGRRSITTDLDDPRAVGPEFRPEGFPPFRFLKTSRWRKIVTSVHEYRASLKDDFLERHGTASAKALAERRYGHDMIKRGALLGTRIGLIAGLVGVSALILAQLFSDTLLIHPALQAATALVLVLLSTYAGRFTGVVWAHAHYLSLAERRGWAPLTLDDELLRIWRASRERGSASIVGNMRDNDPRRVGNGVGGLLAVLLGTTGGIETALVPPLEKLATLFERSHTAVLDRADGFATEAFLLRLASLLEWSRGVETGSPTEKKAPPLVVDDAQRIQKAAERIFENLPVLSGWSNIRVTRKILGALLVYPGLIDALPAQTFTNLPSSAALWMASADKPTREVGLRLGKRLLTQASTRDAMRRQIEVVSGIPAEAWTLVDNALGAREWSEALIASPDSLWSTLMSLNAPAVESQIFWMLNSEAGRQAVRAAIQRVADTVNWKEGNPGEDNPLLADAVIIAAHLFARPKIREQVGDVSYQLIQSSLEELVRNLNALEPEIREAFRKLLRLFDPPPGPPAAWAFDRGGEMAWRQSHGGEVYATAFSPDGTRVVSGSHDRTLRLWDAHTGRQLGEWTGHTDGVHSVAFSPDGSRVVSGSWDRTLRLWDAHTGQQLGQWTGHTLPVYSVAFSPDGSRVVSGDMGGILRLWDAHTGQQLGQQWTGQHGVLTSVAFSPDGARVVSGSWDSTLFFWDAHTGQQLAQLTEHAHGVYSVAFSPDGDRVVSGDMGGILRLWDAHTGQQLEQWTGHTDTVCSIAFSPDGSRIVAGSSDGALHLWDAHTGQHLGQWWNHIGPVSSVAFSPDGAHIVSGSSDHTLQMWRPAPRSPAGQAASKIGQRLYTASLTALNIAALGATMYFADDRTSFFVAASFSCLLFIAAFVSFRIAWFLPPGFIASTRAGSTTWNGPALMALRPWVRRFVIAEETWHSWTTARFQSLMDEPSFGWAVRLLEEFLAKSFGLFLAVFGARRPVESEKDFYDWAVDAVRNSSNYRRLLDVTGFGPVTSDSERFHSVLHHDELTASISRRLAEELAGKGVPVSAGAAELLALTHDFGALPFRHFGGLSTFRDDVLRPLGYDSRATAIAALERAGVPVPPSLRHDMMNFDVNKDPATYSNALKVALTAESIEGVFEDILFAIRAGHVSYGDVPQELIQRLRLRDVSALPQLEFAREVAEMTLAVVRDLINEQPVTDSAGLSALMVRAAAFKRDMRSAFVQKIHAAANRPEEFARAASLLRLAFNRLRSTTDSDSAALEGLSRMSDRSVIDMAGNGASAGDFTIRDILARGRTRAVAETEGRRLQQVIDYYNSKVFFVRLFGGALVFPENLRPDVFVGPTSGDVADFWWDQANEWWQPFVAQMHASMHSGSPRMSLEAAQFQARMIGRAEGETVLDVGLGAGNTVLALAMLRARVIHAVDSDRMAVEATRRNVEIPERRLAPIIRNVERYDIRQDDVSRLTTVGNQTVDTATMFLTGLYVLPGLRARMLRRFHDVLKPGGDLLILDYQPRAPPGEFDICWTAEEWIAALESAGFDGEITPLTEGSSALFAISAKKPLESAWGRRHASPSGQFFDVASLAFISLFLSFSVSSQSWFAQLPVTLGFIFLSIASLLMLSLPIRGTALPPSFQRAYERESVQQSARTPDRLSDRTALARALMKVVPVAAMGLNETSAVQDLTKLEARDLAILSLLADRKAASNDDPDALTILDADESPDAFNKKAIALAKLARSRTSTSRVVVHVEGALNDDQRRLLGDVIVLKDLTKESIEEAFGRSISRLQIQVLSRTSRTWTPSYMRDWETFGGAHGIKIGLSLGVVLNDLLLFVPVTQGDLERLFEMERKIGMLVESQA